MAWGGKGDLTTAVELKHGRGFASGRLKKEKRSSCQFGSSASGVVLDE